MKNADTNLPGGAYVPTQGSNYLLDGFDFKDEPRGGALNGYGHPSVYGISGLPDGLIKSSSGPAVDVDLSGSDGGISAFVKEAGVVQDPFPRIVDLDWLEKAVQNPARLPVNPVDLMIPELVEAWGVNRRTNGLELVPNTEAYRDYSKPLAGPKSGLPPDKLKGILAHAVRKSTLGYPMDEIVRDVRALSKGSFPKLAKSVQAIQQEHGLPGNVYIRASAFPGLLMGRWDSLLTKKCARALYILAEPNSKVAGADRYLGKKVVTEIPWKEAYAHYAPILNATGRRVASGDIRIALRNAFLTRVPELLSREASGLPTHKALVDTVSTRQAMKAWKDAPAPVREVYDPAIGALKRLASVTTQQIQRWVSAGLLSKEDARRILQSSADPASMVRVAANLITSSGKTPIYDGVGVQFRVHVAATRESSWKDLQESEIRTRVALKIRERIVKMAKEGALSSSQAQSILSSKMPPRQMMEEAARLASTAHATPLNEMTNFVQSRPFEGANVKAHVMMDPPTPALDPEIERLSKVAKVGKVALVDVKSLLQKVRQKLSENVIGKDLDRHLAHKYSRPLLAAAKEEIASIRQAHEGLSGQLYVDAEAYASPTGITGCEEGARLHRSDTTPTVMAMPRCTTCTHNIQGSCEKYAKPLVSKIPCEDPAAFQAEALRQANAPKESSDLVNLYDPSEYGLTNDALETFAFNPELPPSGIGEIRFGGMTI